MILASIESLLGSVWFAGMALLGGFILGYVVAKKGLFFWQQK